MNRIIISVSTIGLIIVSNIMINGACNWNTYLILERLIILIV